MGMQVQWDNPDKSILHIALQEAWSWDELHQANQQAASMLDAVSYKVGVVVDVSSAQITLPRGTMLNMQNLILKTQAKVGVVVFVCSEETFRAIRNTFLYVYGGMTHRDNIVVLPTLAEARREIQGRIAT